MRTVILGLVAAVSACHSAAAPPAGSTPAPTASGAAPLDRQLKRPDPIAVSAPLPGFTKGINLGNCYDAPSEGAWGTVISEKHFEMAAAAGFDHVRLPVRFSAPDRTDPKPPFAIREEFWKKVDWAVDQALSRQLSIIVDVHHYEEIHKDPAAHRERLYAMWRQISERYASRPPQVAFEILNEPNGALNPTILDEITAEVIRIIREKNPTRIVMADCYFWAASDYLKTLHLPPNDPNLVGHFHMYQPILFTHQGASWMDPWYQTTGVIFPGPPGTPIQPVPATQGQSWVLDFFKSYNALPIETNPSGPATVFTHFDNAARWVKETGKRVYLGEFGAIDFADAQSRENWVWLVRTEAERRGIGWAYWDDGGKFKAMDTRSGRWNEGLRRALLD
jgi:endoglucanase